MKNLKWLRKRDNEENSVKITPSELEAITGAEGWCDVCKGWKDED